VSSGDGFYGDGSFIQHTDVAYTGSYGLVLLAGMANLLALLTGSAWQVTDPAIGNLIDLVELGYAPLIHDGRMMSMASGRVIVREGSSEPVLGHTAIAAILRLASAADPTTAGRWYAACRGWYDRCISRGPYVGADVARSALVSALYSAVGLNLQAANTDLKGKKSWFCFDEYIVAMARRSPRGTRR
jgi:hyaluronate lyase